MYNGVGLRTPRGSGGNGYVQTNRFSVMPRRAGGSAAASGDPPHGKDGDISGSTDRKATDAICQHAQKRQIHLRLLVLEETLADQGYTASEIGERLAAARETYETEPAAAVGEGETTR